MRAKELKEMLNKLPDNTEIVIRGQMHRITKNNRLEVIGISSANPRINENSKKLILNPNKKLRGMAWIPECDEEVSCFNCVNYQKMEQCIRYQRSCDKCTINCACQKCNHYNPESYVPFAERPMWEKK